MIAERLPDVYRTCRRCKTPHAAHRPMRNVPGSPPRSHCNECRKVDDAKNYERRKAGLQKPRHYPIRDYRPIGRPPQGLNTDPPALGKRVLLDCLPPISGTVVRVDLARGLFWLQEYGEAPFGFGEIRK